MRLLVVSALVALAVADVSHLQRLSRPVSSDANAQILRYDSDITPEGGYAYSFETDNGIAAQAQGQQVQIGAESGNSVQGSFQYNSPEGVPVGVQYVANENGYQPVSDIFPTPPPVPAAILRALEYNAAHPEQEQEQTGGVRQGPLASFVRAG